MTSASLPSFLHFFLAKLGKKLVRQFHIETYSFRHVPTPFSRILRRRATSYNRRLRIGTCQIGKLNRNGLYEDPLYSEFRVAHREAVRSREANYSHAICRVSV